MSASGFEPLRNSPEARAKITSALLAHGWERGVIEEVLDLYASEPARQIREERKAVEAGNVASHALPLRWHGLRGRHHRPALAELAH
ncbi:hypothetical protein [Streptomyces sp. NPDC000351]|uniref:hypothetical protein n=1 Tax=Streptomyces sp. NPDC000351 TaxID=3154250 RepID=UPI003332F7D0